MMEIYKNDKELYVVVKCDNKRQFRLIKASFKIFFVGKKLIVNFNKYTKEIKISCNDIAQYDDFFKNMAHQMAVAKQKGHIVKVNIKDV